MLAILQGVNHYKYMADTSKEERSIENIIIEQRRDQEYLIHIFDRMRNSENILLTVAVGILSFLYYTVASSDEPDLFKRLFIPEENYGKIIYFIAAAFFTYGFVKLTLTVFGKNPWVTAYENEKTDYDHSKPFETLKYIKVRNDECTDLNGATYNKRREKLQFLFYCILLGGIILIVIKTLP